MAICFGTNVSTMRTHGWPGHHDLMKINSNNIIIEFKITN